MKTEGFFTASQVADKLDEFMELDEAKEWFRENCLPKPKNTIVSIGYTGSKICYLNISKEDAINRYIRSERITPQQFENDYGVTVHTMEFEEEFGAYSLHEI